MKVNKFQRGQIWWYTDNANYDGHVQGGTRPIIIISNNKANENSNVLIGIPCTTAEKPYMPCNTQFVMNGNKNTALGTNIRSINPDRLTEYIGTCDNELMQKLDECIKISLGLTNIEENLYIKDPEKLEKEYTEETKIDLTLPSKKIGRKPKYNLEDMVRFINDYENHDINYMIKKYDEVSDKAVQNKVYRFRKIIGENK